MTSIQHLAALVLLSSLVGSSIVAQAASEQSSVEVASHTNSGREASGRPGAAIAAGKSIGTVWLAPVGHRQPRLVDLPAAFSAPRESLKLVEDAVFDRRINICNRC